MDKRKYALLDTDFISKGFYVKKDENTHLIDRVLELPGYRFFCHSQIVTELGRHNLDAPAWLEEKIKGMEVLSFTDAKILDNLESSMGTLACATYTQMLKESCDSFSRGYFTANYQRLADLDYKVTSKEEYLVLLQMLDEEVGRHNSLGEIKSYVLLQMLAMIFGEQIYVFCSDDKNARNGATNFEGVSCISLLICIPKVEKRNWMGTGGCGTIHSIAG